MAAIWPRSNIKSISFSTEKTQIHDFDVYLGSLGTPDIVVWPESNLAIALWVKFKIAAIFRYAPHSGETRMHPRHCIVG